MFKQTLFIACTVILYACGQEHANHSPVAAADSSVTLPQPTDSAPEKKTATDKLLAFVPAGYAVLDTSSGDLNLDPYADMIMVLKKDGEDSSSDVTEHPEKRPLLILTGQADGAYTLAAKSDNAVYCIDCGGIMGDPFMDVVIKKGYFSVEHYGGSSWRWTRTVTFKYSPADKNWFLHKDGHESFHASEPDKVETKIYTVKDFGKVAFDRFDIYKEE